jgi:hypothetical protein
VVILVVAAIGTLLLAEPAMTLVHRFLFHGPFWCEHKSHHAHPTARRIVRNDRLWFWLAAALSLVLFGGPIVAGIGIGTAAYVAAYILAHDGVAHGRFWVPRVMRRMTVFRIIAHTHHLHHRGGRAGYGAPPFGVYLAPLEHRWRLLAQYTPPTKECSPALTR